MRQIEPVHMAVGARIKMIREMMGITQEDLQVRLKAAGYTLTRASIANVEIGRQRLLLHTVDAFARALGVSSKHLMKGIWW